MAELVVQMPIIGLSALDLTPEELADVPNELHSSDPDEALIASVTFALERAMKNAKAKKCDIANFSNEIKKIAANLS